MNYLLQDIKKGFFFKKFFGFCDGKVCVMMKMMMRSGSYGVEMSRCDLLRLNLKSKIFNIFPTVFQLNQSQLTTHKINYHKFDDIYSISVQAVTKMTKNFHTIIP